MQRLMCCRLRYSLSLLTISTCFWSKRSVTSSFAFSMFSLLFRNSMCDVPTLVITARSGLTISASSRISPKLLMPISNTATSVSSST